MTEDNKFVLGAYSSGIYVSEEEASKITLVPLPKSFFISVSKLHKELAKKHLEIDKPLEVNVSSKKQNNIFVALQVMNGITGDTIQLSHYEIKLIDVIGTLVYKQPESSKNITVDQIYRTIIGQPGSKKHASAKFKNQLISNMRKLGSIWVKVDFSQHYEGRNKALEKKGLPAIEDTLTGKEFRLLNFEINYTDSGTTYFKFAENPPLYRYSSDVGNMITSDFKLLQTPEEVKNPFDGFALTTYFIDRINSIKNNPSAKNMNIINFSTLIEMIEHNNSYKLTATKKRTLRKNVVAILDNLVQKGALSDYSITDGQISKQKITLKL